MFVDGLATFLNVNFQSIIDKINQVSSKFGKLTSIENCIGMDVFIQAINLKKIKIMIQIKMIQME